MRAVVDEQRTGVARCKKIPRGEHDIMPSLDSEKKPLIVEYAKH